MRIPGRTVVGRRSRDVHTRVSSSEHFRNIALGVAGVISSILIPVIGLYYTTRDKDREVSKGFVEIAVKILSDTTSDDKNKDDDDRTALREWAIALIDNYSEVKLSNDARNALRRGVPLIQPQTGILPGSTSKAQLADLNKRGYVMGINVFRPQESIDFALLKQHEIEFVYFKAARAPTDAANQLVAQRAREARQQGLKVGLYYLFMPRAGSDDGYSNFAAELGAIDWDLPPVIDCEDFTPSSPLPSDYAARVVKFAEQLEQRFGVKPMIYTGNAFAAEHLDQQAAKYPLFIARYQSKGDAPATLPPWWKDYAFWHFATGVNDDPVLQKYDIFAFKGTDAQLAALTTGKK